MRRKPTIAAKDVAVEIDPKLEKLYDTLIAKVHVDQHADAAAWDDLWETVGSIVNHDPPLWPLGGYGSLAEFFRAVTHETLRTAQRNIRVARFATPKEEEDYGTSILDAALAYLEAMVGHAIDGRLPVSFERLRIPVKRDGKKTKRLLQDVNAKEIGAATRAILKGKHHVVANAVRDALYALVRRASSALDQVQIHERNGLVSFTGVPVAALAAFGHAVASGKALGAKSSGKPKARTKRR